MTLLFRIQAILLRKSEYVCERSDHCCVIVCMGDRQPDICCCQTKRLVSLLIKVKNHHPNYEFISHGSFGARSALSKSFSFFFCVFVCVFFPLVFTILVCFFSFRVLGSVIVCAVIFVACISGFAYCLVHFDQCFVFAGRVRVYVYHGNFICIY